MSLINLQNINAYDLLESTDKNTVDLILTDPPYAIASDNDWRVRAKQAEGAFHVDGDFREWDKEIDLDRFIKESYRVLKQGGTFICWYDMWKLQDLKECMERNGFKQIRLIEWIKTNPMPVNSSVNYLRSVREIALLGVKGGKPTFNSKYDNGIYTYPIGGTDRIHPTQKPLKLFEDLVKKHSNEGDLVMDCFSGSGTTMIACDNLNRDFIGSELSEEYYEKSMERWLCNPLASL